jgi:pimeloyl-ACP methyl ester carboxylesterase
MKHINACVGVGLLLLGCGEGEQDGAPASPATSVVLYGVPETTELTPFPSDRYTVPDKGTATGLRVEVSAATTGDPMAVDLAESMAQLSKLDGFSTTGGVVFKLSSPIDARGIDHVPDAEPPILDPIADASVYTEADSPLLLVNIDADAPEFGKALGLVPRYFEQAEDGFYTNDEFTLIVQPAVPLRPGSRYVMIVTDELRARDGTAVGAEPLMRSALSSAQDAYSVDLRAAVKSATDAVGLSPEHVVAATVFTTGSTLTGVVEMAKARRAAPDPQQTKTWEVESALASPDTRVRFVADFEAPEFRAASDGKWQVDAAGIPKVQSQANLETYLAFSDATQSGPRPVVFYAHGLGGDKDSTWGTAQRLAPLSARGVAVLGIDSPEHGSRAVGETNLVSSVYGFFGIDEDTNEFDIERARDNFRQMASDQLELVRFTKALASLDLLPLDASGNPAPDGVPDLDVSAFYYIGHSFGAVQGATIFAIAPEIEAANWNVGGAGLMMLLRDSNLFSLFVKSISPPKTPFGAVARFMAINQAIVDPGDPLNFARYATLERLEGVAKTDPRDVLIQQVVQDTIVPNSTTEALARAAGLSVLNPVTAASGLSEISAPASGNLPSGATGVVCQFDTMNDGKIASHGELAFSPEGLQQYVSFFQTRIDGKRAVVIAPY